MEIVNHVLAFQKYQTCSDVIAERPKQSSDNRDNKKSQLNSSILFFVSALASWWSCRMKKMGEFTQAATFTCLLYSFSVIVVTSKPKKNLDRLKFYSTHLAEVFASNLKCYLVSAPCSPQLRKQSNNRLQYTTTMLHIEFGKSVGLSFYVVINITKAKTTPQYADFILRHLPIQSAQFHVFLTTKFSTGHLE